MAGTDWGYFDYLKAAFNLKCHIPLLGHMPANKLILAGFVILGIGNPGFLLLGLAYEVAYLLLVSGNSRFQNLVKGQRLLELSEKQSGQSQEMLERLDPEVRLRYERLLQRCRTALQSEQDAQGSTEFTGLKAEGINQLLGIYLKMLNLKSRISQSVMRTRREELEADIKALTAKIAREAKDSPVFRTLQGTLSIQKSRLDNYDRNVDRINFAEAELDRIEKQVSLIAEEVTVGKNAEQWSRTLDDVVQSIQGTTQWMADNSEILESADIPAAPVNLMKMPAPAAPKQPAQAVKQKTT